MKILHLLGDRNLPRRPDDEAAGGVVRAALEIARAQAGLGHEVSIAVITRRPWRAEWQGVRLIGLAAAPWARVRLSGKVLDFRQHLPYAFFTRLQTFDIVQGHLNSYMRLLRARRRVVHFHGDPFYKGSKNEGIDLKPADFTCIARYSDAQIAVSQFVADELRRGLGDQGNVHVVRNCVDTASFDPELQREARSGLRQAWGVREGEMVFLFAGAIVPEKGVIHLARTFARFAADVPTMHLALAGTSGLWGGALAQQGFHREYESEVKQALQAPFEAGRVHFLGKIAASKMPSIYCASDAVVVPSIWREAFGQVALEALAAGRPLVASSTGGLVEIVNDSNAVLVPPGDEAALEVAMRALAENPALRARMGSAAQQQAQRFSWDDAAQQLESIYQSIL